jgi:hypothetical protein
MCNAWNHPPGCTCGWGGVGHLGRRASGHNHASASATSGQYWWVPPIRHAYESFVNPNASCPVCGEPVFFYQSPYGGRVFFDELGPPWPKHPCTDNGSIPSQARTTPHANIAPKPRKTYQWLTDGWKPFFITSARPIAKEVSEIHGTFGEQEICLYIPKVVDHTGHGGPIGAQCVAHIRPSSNNRFEVSVVTNFGKINTIFAFKMASDARASHSPHQNSRTAKKHRTGGEPGSPFSCPRSTKRPSPFMVDSMFPCWRQAQSSTLCAPSAFI